MYPNSTYALAPKYLYREDFKAKVYTIWVRGPLGLETDYRFVKQRRKHSVALAYCMFGLLGSDRMSEKGSFFRVPKRPLLGFRVHP